MTKNISPEQIKLFRHLFSGREDVYGLIRFGFPVCMREPLTDQVLVEHLIGKKRIGRYPIYNGKENGKVKWGVIDIDELNQEKVTRIYISCIENDFYPYLERSREKGYHIWLFFDEVIEAKNVRKVLNKILLDAQITDFELFPKQNQIDSDDGVGNFVFFPLHGESIKKNRTVFLNAQFHPYEDQWGHLAKINLTKTENILEIAKSIPDETDHKANQSRVDISKPPWGVKVCYWRALNEGVNEKVPGRHDMALRLSKFFQVDQGNPPEVARAMLIEWNQRNRPPMTEKELNVDRTVADGLKYDYGCNDEKLKTFCSADCKYHKSCEPEPEKDSRPDNEQIGLSLLTPSTVNNFPPTEPLFEGYPLALRHLNALVGSPGDLKTLTTYEIARCVLKGEPLYGKYPCLQKGSVIIIDEDNPGDIVQERYTRFGFTSDDLPIYLSHMVGFQIDRPGWYEKLRASVNKIKPVLIIVDCFANIHNKKENQVDEIIRVMKQFRTISNLGPCILFVHHLTKDKENPSARGSGGIIGAVENEIWNIRKGNGLLQFTKKTRRRPLNPIELAIKGFEDETGKAPICIEYQGDEIQILLDHITASLEGDKEAVACSSGIEEADTIENRLKDNKISFTDAKLKSAISLGVKSGRLTRGRATLTRKNGKPFRVDGYLVPFKNP